MFRFICFYIDLFLFAIQVKSDVRRLKGIPALVSMLDNPNREVGLLIFLCGFQFIFLLKCVLIELFQVKVKIKGCSVLLMQHRNNSLAWRWLNLRITTNTVWKGNKISVTALTSPEILQVNICAKYGFSQTFCGFSVIPFHLVQTVAKLCWCLYGHYQSDHIMHSTV